MTLLYGVTPEGEIARYPVPANSFVVIPPGTVHANFNETCDRRATHRVAAA